MKIITNNIKFTENYFISDSDWDKLSHCMYDSSFAIKIDDTLWGTGLNTEYQLGLNDTNNRNTFTQIGTDEDWTKIKSHSYHSMALKSNGTLWGAGQNGYDQLGIAGGGNITVFTPTD